MAAKILNPNELKKLIGGYQKKLEAMDIPITHIYIYGSYAKKTPRKDSDIDLCVISPAFQDRIESTMTLMKIRDDDELVLSPLAFSPETFIDENPIAWEIKQTGVMYI